MKQRLFCLATAAVLLIGCLLSGCTNNTPLTKYTAHSMEYFDTVTTVTGYAENQEAFDAVVNAIWQQLGEYHKLYTVYHRFDGLENLCTVNELVDGKHRTVKADPRIIDMLLYAKEMHTLTNGTMNVAMGSVLSLWHDHRTVGKDNPDAASLPPMARLQAASAHTDIADMVIDKENGTVLLTDPEMKLDVGAVAKGYATERVALWLEEQGVSHFVLNVGGNVRTVGGKADGSKWTVGIENPDGGDYLAYLELDGQSLVTSGSYQRFYYVDGKPYHHIIHPDTLMPAVGYRSVSVICNHSGLGDALSTALFCMSKEDGQHLIESLDGVEALWVTENGEQWTSSGWHHYVK